MQSEAGVLSVTGTPESPAKVGISIADIGTGTACLCRRSSPRSTRARRTGEGAHIDVTMFETLAEWMGHPLYYTHYSRQGAAAQRPGPRDHRALRPFPHARMAMCMFGIQNEREWANFCDKVLGRPELAKDPRYDSNTKRTAAPRRSGGADRE